MTKYEEVVNKIIATYEGNMDGLKDYHRFHWFVRSYRITGDKKYLDKIYYALLTYKYWILESLGSMTSTASISERSTKLLANYNSKKNGRKAKQLIFYNKYPFVPVYLETLNYLFTLNSLGLTEEAGIRDCYNIALDYYKKNNVSSIFLEDEFIKIHPSESANAITYLAFLGISDDRKKQLDISEKYWQGIKPNSHDIWLDKIYALTHIMIAASEYYQKFVKREDFEWILGYFESNIDEILANCTTDVIAEVGLSFKLVGEFDTGALNKVKDYLATAFNEKCGYIAKKKGPGLDRSEHRNILSVMVLKDFSTLHPGPNLSKYISTI